MKLQTILETKTVTGELQVRDRSAAGNIARELIAGAGKRVMQDGNKPNTANIKKAAEKAANNFYSLMLQAIDREFNK